MFGGSNYVPNKVTGGGRPGGLDRLKPNRRVSRSQRAVKDQVNHWGTLGFLAEIRDPGGGEKGEHNS